MTAPRSRLAEVFARTRQEGRKALVVYLTAGDPDAETSRRLLLAAASAGADILEVGVPWSDPSADGPAIQSAMLRALAAGGGLRSTMEICRQVRAANEAVPLVLFGYANPVFVRGPKAFADDAAAAGADGVLCVDWPPDEASELTSELRRHGLDFIPLLAPTSTAARISRVLPAGSGFIYYISLTGITGAAMGDLQGPRRHVEEIRAASGGRLPIVVGFGIKSAADVRAVAGFADGVVVGSAAVKVIEEAKAAGRDPVPELEAFVRELRSGLDAGSRP